MILGDLLAPVFAPWYDYGYSPDPVAEFLGSLETGSTRSGRSSSRSPATGARSKT